VFVTDKLLQPRLMFGGKAGAYLSEAPLYAPLLGRLLDLLANIRLGCSGLPGQTL
jgi:hypothetical protein